MKPTVRAVRNKPMSFDGLAKRLSKNTLWILSFRLGTQGLMLVFNILLAKRLGAAGLGQYAFIVSVVLLGNVFTTFGTDMILVRHIAAEKNMSLVAGVLQLQLVLALPTVVVLFGIPASLFGIASETIHALKVYGLALIPMAFNTAFSASLRGVERMDVLAWLNVTTAFVQVCLAVMVIHAESTIMSVAYILLGTQVFSAILGTIFCIRYINDFRPGWRISFEAIRDIFKTSRPIAFLGILGVFYQRITILLLTLLASSAATGWYSAASRLTDIPKIGHYALLTALLPVMAHADAGASRVKSETTDHVFGVALGSLVTFSAVSSLILFLGAAPLVKLLYGEVFLPAASVMKILALTLIPFSINNYYSLRFFTTRHEAHMLILLAGAALTLVVLNLYAIPRWSVNGVAMATLIAETLQAAGYLFLWRQLSLRHRK